LKRNQRGREEQQRRNEKEGDGKLNLKYKRIEPRKINCFV
jgi:hypothetical protein